MTRARIFLLASAFYLFGAWLCVQLNSQKLLNVPVSFASFYGQKVQAEGTIVSDPGKSGTQASFYFLPGNGTQKILVSTLSKKVLAYGDRAIVVGKLREPTTNKHEHFDYASYLKSRNVYGQISYAQVFILKHRQGNPIIYGCLAAKRAVYKQIFTNLSYKNAALLISLLTGQKDFLDKATLSDFSLSGTAHIVAVSGFILTLIMLGFEKMSPYIGKKVAYAFVAFSAAAYLIMTAFAPGVVRAAVMSALVIIAKIVGRKYSLLPALALTACVLVAFEPMIIKYDLGFLLSFASILGIYFFSPVLKACLGKIPETFGAREIIASTLSAQLATTPITLYYFDQFSVIAPLANLLILPIVPALSIFGYACALPVLGKLAGWIFKWPLEYMLFTVNKLAHLPGAFSSFSISARIFVAIYAFEALLYFALKSTLKKKGFFVTIDGKVERRI